MRARESARNTVWRGLAALVVVNAIFLAAGWMLVALFPRTGPGPWYAPLAPPVYLFGLTRWLWAVPWGTWAFATGRRRWGVGLILGTLVTLAANGVLFLVAMGAMDLPH